MAIYIPRVRESSQPPAARPIRERTLTATAGKGIRLTYRGLWLYFSADQERVYAPLLAAGKLNFVAFSDRVELRQQNGEGAIKVLGRALLGPEGTFLVQGVPAADKHGLIKCRESKPYRHVAAESLFPEFGKVRRANHYEESNQRAEIVHDRQAFVFPTGQHAHFGAAVREQRIIALADSRKIEFYERTPAGQEEYIGTIELTDERLKQQERVRVDEYIEKFALHDLPVRLYGNDVRVEHRGLVFVFSADPKNVYFRDIFEGRLFLRVGFADRIEVIRKTRNEEELIGSLPTKDLPLDRPARNGNYFRVDRLIEELNARDVTLDTATFPKGVQARIFNIVFYFPMRAGNAYREAARTGRLVCRTTRSTIAVGTLVDRRFSEIGRIEFSPTGNLLTSTGRMFKINGKPVKRLDPRLPGVNIERLIPELGRLEKRAGLGAAGAIMHREIRYLFDLEPGDIYYNELLTGHLVFRAVGRRMELFCERADGHREYIGDCRLNKENQLETQAGELYRTAHGPVAAGERRDARVSRLIAAFKAGKQEIGEVFEHLSEKSYDGLYEIFVNGQARRWLKLFTMVGKGYLASGQADEVLAVKLLFALAYGLENLAAPNQLSPDLKQAFAREILETMALVFTNPSLGRVRDSMRLQYERALLAAEKINQAL